MFSVSRPTVVYDGAVTSADLDEWGHEFDAVMGRMRSLFYRTESKKHAEQYVRGLLSPLARKNGWTISEYVGEPEPKALQRLLNLSPWDVDALLALNREYAMENLADPGGILVADPTGFAKKGRMSVGVQRQYSGTLGRIDNCQIVANSKIKSGTGELVFPVTGVDSGIGWADSGGWRGVRQPWMPG